VVESNAMLPSTLLNPITVIPGQPIDEPTLAGMATGKYKRYCSLLAVDEALMINL